MATTKKAKKTTKKTAKKSTKKARGQSRNRTSAALWRGYSWGNCTRRRARDEKRRGQRAQMACGCTVSTRAARECDEKVRLI